MGRKMYHPSGYWKSAKSTEMLALYYRNETKIFVYLMDALAGLSTLLCPGNIAGFILCPAIADGKISLCGGGITSVATSCFATGASSGVHSIFSPCCCQGAARDGLLFFAANMTRMRNSK
jgi:hypothetical protein